MKSSLPPRYFLFVIALLFPWAAGSARTSDKAKSTSEHWIRLRSDHFLVLSDADERHAHGAAVRFEQMRAIFGELLSRKRVIMGEPLDIVVLKDTGEYAKVLLPGSPVNAGGFFLSGTDRDYVVLDASQPENWKAVAYPFALMLLNYNYPPTQAWFDEGFAEYLCSLRLSDTQAEIGGDPEITTVPEIAGRSFTALLESQQWLSLPGLFKQAQGDAALFHAEAWAVVHYLISHNKLPEVGTYFGLAENERMPEEQAIQQAFGESGANLEQAIKEHLQSFRNSQAGQQIPAPITADMVGSTRQEAIDAEGDALLAEMELRVPAHRDDGVTRLNSIMNDPNVDSAIAHRALAWDDMQRNQPADAIEELKKALDLDPNDMWAHYYIALAKYRAAAAQGKLPVLGNIMLDLRAVIDASPEFAEAYHMLAMARLEGGGNNSALDAIREAIQLSPRNQTYLLHLAEIDMAAKKWDDATALLQQLKASSDARIAQEASRNLDDLPTVRKYGILPLHEGEAAAANPPESEEPKVKIEVAEKPVPDKRQVQFMKGKLLSVDCSRAPVAVLNVSGRTKRMKLRTQDYKSLVLVGADQFSCDWKDVIVAVNYKARGPNEGDLVSLELQ